MLTKRRTPPDYAAIGRAFSARQARAAASQAGKPTAAQIEARRRNAAIAREKKYRQALHGMKAGGTVE